MIDIIIDILTVSGEIVISMFCWTLIISGLWNGFAVEIGKKGDKFHAFWTIYPRFFKRAEK